MSHACIPLPMPIYPPGYFGRVESGAYTADQMRLYAEAAADEHIRRAIDAYLKKESK